MMRFWRMIGLLTGLIAAAGGAAASPSDYTAPEGRVLDDNGVDLVTGQYVRSDTFLTIGDPANGGLAWTYTGHPGTDNFTGEIWRTPVTSPSYRTVKLGSSSERFNGTATEGPNGTKLETTATAFLYTTGNGTVYTFTKLIIDQPTYSNVREAVLTSIARPNGDIVTIHQDFDPTCTAGTQTCPYRTKSVVSNRGYAFKYEYKPAYFDQLTAIRAVNRSTYYCDDLIASCTAYDSAITFDYVGFHFKITDAMGNSTFYGIDNNNVLDVEVVNYVKQADGWEINTTYDTFGRITSLTHPEGSWTYTYNDNTLAQVQNLTQPRRVILRDSSGGIEKTVYVRKDVMLPLSVEDALGRIVTYNVAAQTGYQGRKWGRITSVTQPEGNKVSYTYNGRGSVTSVTETPKTGSGLSSKTVNINYDASCTNYVTCNQPNWVQDAKGNYIYFTYDAAHGGTTSVTKPADSTGLTPKTVMTYAQFTAQIKNSSGILINAGTVWLPHTISTCRTAVTCDNTVNQTKITTAYATSNLLPTTATTAAGDNSLAVAVTTAYDSVGNAVSVDGPLSGTGDQSFKTYDANRRVVFDITADPDGTGSLVRAMTKKVYDSMGRVTQAETGTGTSTTGGDFDRKTYVVTHYNARGLKDQVTSYIDGVTAHQTLSQFNYDIRGQLICTAVRMNMAVSQTADPCSLHTEGSDGPDRITKNTYDTAGQLTQVDEAYGTSVQRAYARYTYTNNGLKATEKDANGNLTTLEYDGFDRLKKLRHPSTTVGAGTSSTTDYEEFAYDANGNKTSWRRRNAVSITYCYDNLNRTLRENVSGVSCSSGGQSGDVFTTYDLASNIKSKRFGSTTGNGVSYIYDALNRVTSTTDLNGRSLYFAYNAASARSATAYPDGYTFYISRDNLNRLSHVSNGSTVFFSQTYFSTGERKKLLRGGLIASGERNDSACAGQTNATCYGYGDQGNLTSMKLDLYDTTHDATWTFGPRSPAGQITNWYADSTVYDYEEIASSTVNRAYDGLNRDAGIAAISGGYDNNGNLAKESTSAAGTRCMTYDNLNRLLSVAWCNNQGSPFLSLFYDTEGRLAAYTGNGTTSEFVYDGVNLIAEYSYAGAYNGNSGSETMSQRYVHGTGTDEPLMWYAGSSVTSPNYLLANYQGSIIGYSGSAGSLTEIYKYGPYGEPINSAGAESWTGSRFRYTGQYAIPEAELYYYKARVYDPYYGRFLQTDPIGSEDDLNLYQYVGGDPINGSDPTGMIEPDCSALYNNCIVNNSDPSTGAIRAAVYFTTRDIVTDGNLERVSNTKVEYGNGWSRVTSDGPYDDPGSTVEVRIIGLAKGVHIEAEYRGVNANKYYWSQMVTNKNLNGRVHPLRKDNFCGDNYNAKCLTVAAPFADQPTYNQWSRHNLYIKRFSDNAIVWSFNYGYEIVNGRAQFCPSNSTICTGGF